MSFCAEHTYLPSRLEEGTDMLLYGISTIPFGQRSHIVARSGGIRLVDVQIGSALDLVNMLTSIMSQKDR